MSVQIRCLRLMSLEVDIEIEVFIRDQHLWKVVGESRIGHREKSNCNEAWQSLCLSGRELWRKYYPSECPEPSWNGQAFIPCLAQSPSMGCPRGGCDLGRGSFLHLRPTLMELTAGGSLLSKLAQLGSSRSWRGLWEVHLHDYHIMYSVNFIFLKKLFFFFCLFCFWLECLLFILGRGKSRFCRIESL